LQARRHHLERLVLQGSSGGAKKSAYLTSFVFESEPMPSISPSSTSSSLSLKPSGAFKSTLPNVGPSSSSDSSSSSCAAFEIVALAPRGLEPQSIPSSSSSSKSLSPRASACSRNSDCLLKSSMEKKPSLRPCGSGMYSAASSLSASDSPSLPIATSSSASISDSSKSSTSPSTPISSSSSSSSPSTSSPSTSYVLLGELIEVALGLLPSGIDNAPCLFPDLLDSKPFDVDLFQTQNLLIFIVLAALPLFASFLQALLLCLGDGFGDRVESLLEKIERRCSTPGVIILLSSVCTVDSFCLHVVSHTA
ncbi:hypothetical protein KCU92_g222, partial [Aureobasidium melanogenum]